MARVEGSGTGGAKVALPKASFAARSQIPQIEMVSHLQVSQTKRSKLGSFFGKAKRASKPSLKNSR
jgi:hypothetical protein